MCVLYVSFGSKVRRRTFWCVAMDSAVLFILRHRLLLYSSGSGVNRVPVFLLSGITSYLCSFNSTIYGYTFESEMCAYHSKAQRGGFVNFQNILIALV